ncbi:methyltransferase, partial [Micromonospora azadirachtae]
MRDAADAALSELEREIGAPGDGLDRLRLAPTPFVPEVRLHQADEPIGLWELTEGEFRSDQPPPFWAFAWAGGQALARYVTDHPEVVAG